MTGEQGVNGKEEAGQSKSSSQMSHINSHIARRVVLDAI
jgi:hypothetical protein